MAVIPITTAAVEGDKVFDTTTTTPTTTTIIRPTYIDGFSSISGLYINLMDYISDGEIVTIGDTTYNWVKRDANTFHWIINGDPNDLDNNGPLEVVPEPLRDWILEDAFKRYLLHTYYGDSYKSLSKEQRESKVLAICYLLMPDNFLLKRYKAKFDEWHAGDERIKVSLFRGSLRVGYHNHSSLVHNNITGDTRGGKSDLAIKFLTFIPEEHKLILHSTSPTAIFYLTRSQDPATKGKLNPDYYDGKIIAVLEAAEDSDKNFTALKAIAEETEETPERIVTINGEAVKLQIKGARSVILTSVHGSADEQVSKRFIHSSVTPNTEENKALKINKLVENFLKAEDISKDNEVKIINEALSLLLDGRDKEIVFDIGDEAESLIIQLPKLFDRSGYSTTQVNQFLTLCQTTAFEKRFARNGEKFETAPCVIDYEDVQEAWYIINTMEQQTKSVLTETELRILTQIKDFSLLGSIELDESETSGGSSYYQDMPTQRDIAKETALSRATVSRALHPKPDKEGRIGKLLELGYVDYGRYKVYYYDGKETRCDTEIKYTGFELTDLGESVLSTSEQSIIVDGKTYTPKDPLGLVHSTDEEGNFTVSWQFHDVRNLQDGVASPDCQSNMHEDIQYNEFHNFIKKFIERHVCLEAAAAPAPDKLVPPPSAHTETVKLRNPHDEKGKVEELTSNEERSEVRSSSTDHEIGMKLRNLPKDDSQITIVRSAATFLTDLKRRGECNGKDREYIKEELWQFCGKSSELLDRLVQDRAIADLIEEIHMARSRPHAGGDR